MQITANEIATIIKGRIEGDPNVIVSKPSKIEEAEAGTISFLANKKYEPYLYSTGASIIIISEDITLTEKVPSTLIWVPDAYHSLSVLLNMFDAYVNKPKQRYVSDKAHIETTAMLKANVSVGHFSVILEDSYVGENTIIHDQVSVGKGVSIGKNCIIHSGVKIYQDCIIGDNCILHSNVVIGSDGFGFAPIQGSYNKIPQLGNVVIEDEVEIGAGTTIDRATMGSTLIRKGVKLDNLIQIAHNVEIGEHTVIAALTGVAGSTKIGKHCRIGGQVGIIGHITIADNTMIQAQSGIGKSIKEKGQGFYGSPAIAYNNYLRSYAVFKHLPALVDRIHTVEKSLKKLLRED